MSGLQVEALSKSYGKHPAVVAASLTVPRGEVVALVGPNGAGKSTLIRSILQLEHSTATEISVDGRPMAAVRSDRYRGVGYASQETAVNELLTVRANLALLLGLRGIRRGAAKARLELALTTFGLDPLADRRADALSGGEQRRLHIAAAFLDCEQLLILDEPTVGADFASTDAIIQEIAGAAERGAAVLVTTHHLKEIAQLRATVVPIVAGQTRAPVPFDEFSPDFATFDSQIRAVVS